MKRRSGDTGAANMKQILLFFAAIAPFLSLSISVASQTKPIVDGTGAFGKALLEHMNSDPEGAQKRNIKPFVIGYCGWRTKTIAQYPITKYDGLQLGLCRTILQPFDNQLTGTLASLENQTSTITKSMDASEAEKKAIHEFAVLKYGLPYLGLPDSRLQPDPIAKWKFNVGGNLGEIAAHLTIWWRIWTNAEFEVRIGKLLGGLNRDIKSAPKAADSKFLAALRKLATLGTKTKFTTEERARINALLTDALIASLQLAKLSNSGDSTSTDAASIVPPVVGSVPSVRKSAAGYLEDGKALAAKGEFQKAIAEFDQAIKIEPGNGVIYFNRALMREKLGQLDEAIRDYDGVILLRVSPREAYFNRGTLLLNKKEHKAAISDFDSAISLDPKYEAALYNRGLAHYNSKNYFAAQADFNNLIKLQPKHANAYIMRSYVYCAQGLRMSAIRDEQMAVQLGAKAETSCK